MHACGRIGYLDMCMHGLQLWLREHPGIPLGTRVYWLAVEQLLLGTVEPCACAGACMCVEPLACLCMAPCGRGLADAAQL